MTDVCKMDERWRIWVCPECNGYVRMFPQVHNETCPNRGRVFAPRDVEVVPLERAEKAEAAARDFAEALKAGHHVESGPNPGWRGEGDNRWYDEDLRCRADCPVCLALARYPEYAPSVPERAPWLSVDGVALAWQSPSKLHSRLPSEHSLDQEEDR